MAMMLAKENTSRWRPRMRMRPPMVSSNMRDTPKTVFSPHVSFDEVLAQHPVVDARRQFRPHHEARVSQTRKVNVSLPPLVLTHEVAEDDPIQPGKTPLHGPQGLDGVQAN